MNIQQLLIIVPYGADKINTWGFCFSLWKFLQYNVALHHTTVLLDRSAKEMKGITFGPGIQLLEMPDDVVGIMYEG